MCKKKNIVDEINNRLDTTGKNISKLEVESIQNIIQKEKKMTKM